MPHDVVALGHDPLDLDRQVGRTPAGGVGEGGETVDAVRRKGIAGCAIAAAAPSGSLPLNEVDDDQLVPLQVQVRTMGRSPMLLSSGAIGWRHG
jgi:hypothetical protein